MRKWCIWCETGTTPKDGYLWIHEDCFIRYDAVRSNLGKIEKYLKGELPRILSNGNRQGYESVEEFLVAMEDFDRRSRNVSKLIKSVRQGTPMEPLEQGEWDA